MAKVVVIAGPNGAGKSTTAPSILREALIVREFVNADAIAADRNPLCIKYERKISNESRA